MFHSSVYHGFSLRKESLTSLGPRRKQCQSGEKSGRWAIQFNHDPFGFAGLDCSFKPTKKLNYDILGFLNKSKLGTYRALV